MKPMAHFHGDATVWETITGTLKVMRVGHHYTPDRLEAVTSTVTGYSKSIISVVNPQ